MWLHGLKCETAANSERLQINHGTANENCKSLTWCLSCCDPVAQRLWKLPVYQSLLLMMTVLWGLLDCSWLRVNLLWKFWGYWFKVQASSFIFRLEPLNILRKDWKVLTKKSSEEVRSGGSKCRMVALKFWHCGLHAWVSYWIFKAGSLRKGWKVLSEELWLRNLYTPVLWMH